jgi:uncharacterized delta-60 repeat protein
MLRARLIALLIALGTVALPASAAEAVPGALDPTFSNDGLRELEFGELVTPGHPAVAADLAPLGSEPSGDVILAGHTIYIAQCFGHLGCSRSRVPTLVRVNPDGSLDSTLTGDGKLEAQFGSPYGGVSDWALQPDGRILAAILAGRDIHVLRLNPDGSLDQSFSGDGTSTVTVPEAVSVGQGTQLGLQADGSIVIANMYSDEAVGNRHFLTLFRLEPDGDQDSSFASGGRATIELASRPYQRLFSALIDSADRIVALTGDASPVPGSFDARFVFRRFAPGGSVDTGFGDQGSSAVPVDDLVFEGEHLMSIDAAERIYGLLPEPMAYGYGAGSVVRLQADGTPDPTYGPGGVRELTDRPADVLIDALAVQDNALLLAGVRRSQLYVSRRLGDGAPDPAFGSGGWTETTTVLRELSNAAPLALSDGRIVVGAGAGSLSEEPCAVIARYQSDDESEGTPAPDAVPCSDPCKPIHGCPYIRTKLTLQERRHRLVGHLKSKRRGCLKPPVKLYSRQLHEDPVLAADRRLARLGRKRARFAFERRPGFQGRHVYALVKQRLDPALGTCGRSRSPTIRIGAR